MILEWIVFIFMILYGWITTFLWHEYFHIKSQGILNTGEININKWGFTASVDNKDKPRWCRLAGGFLSGILHLFIGGILAYFGLWYMYIPLITFGMINLIYGFWEMDHGGEGRYKIYAITLLIMSCIWILAYLLLWR